MRSAGWPGAPSAPLRTAPRSLPQGGSHAGAAPGLGTTAGISGEPTNQ